MTTPRRRRAWLRGRRGESLAAWWLRLKGYHLLARNFRSGAGEIDLIAQRGRVLALVGVQRDLRRVLARLTREGEGEGVPAEQVRETVRLAKRAHRTALMAAHYEDVRAVLRDAQTFACFDRGMSYSRRNYRRTEPPMALMEAWRHTYQCRGCTTSELA